MDNHFFLIFFWRSTKGVNPLPISGRKFQTRAANFSIPRLPSAPPCRCVVLSLRPAAAPGPLVVLLLRPIAAPGPLAAGPALRDPGPLQPGRYVRPVSAATSWYLDHRAVADRRSARGANLTPRSAAGRRPV